MGKIKLVIISILLNMFLLPVFCKESKNPRDYLYSEELLPMFKNYGGFDINPAYNEANRFISYVAEIGVVLIMFSAGLGTNLKSLIKSGIKSTVIAICGVSVPLIMGTIMALCFWGFDGFGTKQFYEALFIGTILTATSVSITVATLQELGVIKSEIGQTIISAAIIDDIIGIIVLTIVLGVSSGTGGYLEIFLKTIQCN